MPVLAFLPIERLPIQINYLGYPGTLGADFMDYIVADRSLIPVESSELFRETTLSAKYLSAD